MIIFPVIVANGSGIIDINVKVIEIKKDKLQST